MQTAQPAPKKTGYVEANGVKYYYEVRGAGEPAVELGRRQVRHRVQPIAVVKSDRRRSSSAVVRGRSVTRRTSIVSRVC